jgi:hypothetical protein
LPLKLLVIGGYGTFGGRLVELLKDEPRLHIVVAGRSAQRAADFCANRDSVRAQLQPAAFDRDGDVLEQLRALGPDVLVDATGPFQDYGKDPYRLIEACIARGIDYLDLADGSEFVAGVRAFDDRARARGVYALSGVSSFPVLTAAAVRHLSSGMTRIASIRGGIAPSPYAGVGRNVIRAIAGYAGKRIVLRRGGQDAAAYPLIETHHFTIAPPGRVPLNRTLFSLVDVPDLRALAELWPETLDIWMGAGPVPQVLHRALIALAWLVRVGVLPSLSALAALMHFATNHLRWGEHRGGMFIAVIGVDSSGEVVKRSWHLLAEGDDGPFIPSMAIEAIVRNVLDGRRPAPGARAAVRELELSDYGRLFRRRSIYTGTRDDDDNRRPLFETLLGEAMHKLPKTVREMHALSRQRTVAGRCSIDRGTSALARCIASFFGFPKAADDLPVSVQFMRENGHERWTRTFGEQTFSSTMRAGAGVDERLLCERIGFLDFAQALVVEEDRLRLVLRRSSLFGITLPAWLAPRSNSYESEREGRFRFHVEISHPLVGLIVRYRGWLIDTA